jgi:hypothetical protein
MDRRAAAPDCDNRSDEREKLTLLPLTIMAILKVDVLARELGIPLVITGKLGLDTIFWRSRRGGDSQGSGRSLGLRWGVMFALELDFIEPRAARRLDEDWGINHSYLFMELYGSLLGTRASPCVTRSPGAPASGSRSSAS